MFPLVTFTQVSGPLVTYVCQLDLERQRISRTHSDAGRTVIAFLAKAIVQGIETELANSVALGAIVAIFSDALNAQQPITTQQ